MASTGRSFPGHAGARHRYPFDSKKETNGSQQVGVSQPPWMKTMVRDAASSSRCMGLPLPL
jgi:hypothetical protein